MKTKHDEIVEILREKLSITGNRKTKQMWVSGIDASADSIHQLYEQESRERYKESLALVETKIGISVYKDSFWNEALKIAAGLTEKQ